MSESFTISFQGSEAISTMVGGIKDKVDALRTEGSSEEDSGLDPEITISSFGAENAVEEFLMDVLDEIQTQAVDSESDFAAHS